MYSDVENIRNSQINSEVTREVEFGKS